LQAQPARVLRRPEQPRILAPIAGRILNHLALGLAKDRDLESLLNRDEARIVPAAAHDCRGCGSGNGLTERRGASAIVVLGFIGGGIVATNSGVSVAAVGVKISRHLCNNRT
jgi:hypothetical protein